MKISSNYSGIEKMSRKRSVIFSIILAVVIFAIIFLSGELLVRFFSPQACLFPRWEYSPEYGTMFPKSTKIVHVCPGRWKFVYTINEYQYRGKAIPISNNYDKRNIIILGDSYSFGTGVNDGDEYSAIMSSILKDNFNIVNLSVSGWGLTQEIRRYYEFGQLYNPTIVILNFCGNDLFDNFAYKVTEVQNGRFVFRNSDRTKNWLIKFLSESRAIQMSQFYSFLRNWYYRIK